MVAAFLSVTDDLSRLDPAELDGAQAATISTALAAGVSRLGVTGARMLPAIEADGRWATGGARSFALWVADQHRVGVPTARALVRLGRTLRDDLPATAAAAAAGDITLGHAQALATLAPTTDLRREVLADPDNECNEAFLVAQARVMRVDDFRALVRRWAAAADPDADDRGYREAAEREYLELSRVFEGYHLEGQLTVEHAAAGAGVGGPGPRRPGPRAGGHREGGAAADQRPGQLPGADRPGR